MTPVPPSGAGLAKLPAKGLIVAAPSSGSGKTLFTLALLRALRNATVAVTSAKVGPDYIDPAFHHAASGQPCLNLDTWAMRPETLSHLITSLNRSCDLVIAEGVMGLFDGADCDDDMADGSTASLARVTGWPVVLLVDARAQAASAAAVVRGFSEHSPDVEVAGVIFNRVGSQSHADTLIRACRKHLPDVSVLGCLPRTPELVLPERHLGLIQAGEHTDLEQFLEMAARWVSEHVDLAAVQSLARKSSVEPVVKSISPLPPLGQRIAVARDHAFAFCYPATLDGWSGAGAAIMPFSPLAGESPDLDCDSVYLPGGYPELYAGQLAMGGFIEGIQRAAAKGLRIFGECGGYMVLGNVLIDADDTHHRMAGLLALETSFAERKLHLGYRDVETLMEAPIGAGGSPFRGHEFHYATILREAPEKALFRMKNARGEELDRSGNVVGNVAGSFIHLIDSC